jgi:hypothetical protein
LDPFIYKVLRAIDPINEPSNAIFQKRPNLTPCTPRDTLVDQNTETHIYIYIYIYVRVCVCVFVRVKSSQG